MVLILFNFKRDIQGTIIQVGIEQPLRNWGSNGGGGSSASGCHSTHTCYPSCFKLKVILQRSCYLYEFPESSAPKSLTEDVIPSKLLDLMQ